MAILAEDPIGVGAEKLKDIMLSVQWSAAMCISIRGRPVTRLGTVPLTIVSGFLGDKTSLLNHLLTQSAEFGGSPPWSMISGR